MGDVLFALIALAAAVIAGVCLGRISHLSQRVRELDDYVRKLHAYVGELHRRLEGGAPAPETKPFPPRAAAPTATAVPAAVAPPRVALATPARAPATEPRPASDAARTGVPSVRSWHGPGAGAGAGAAAGVPTPERSPVPAPLRAPDPVAAPPVTVDRTATAPSRASAFEPDPAQQPSEPAAPTDAGSLEAFLGGRVALVVGVVAVLFAVGYFLKIAIDKGWIGDGLRVALGALFGAACVFGGDRLRKRGFEVFGQSLMGAGLGAFYICDYFASVKYGFWSRPVAFAIVAALTAAGAIVAVRRAGPFLAWLGFAGAFLAPVLLGQNVDALEGLTLWLIVVDLGVGATLAFRRWTGLDAFAAGVSAFYFVGWQAEHFREPRLGAATTCLAALVAVAVVITLLPAALARRRLSGASIAAALATLLIGYLVAYDLCFPDHREGYAAATLGFAALVTGFGFVHRKRVADGAPDAEALFAAAVALVVMAVPILFRGAGVAPAWSAVGAAAIHAATKLRRPWLVTAGFVAIALAGGDALRHRIVPGDAAPLGTFGVGFVSALAPCAALLVAAWSLRRAEGDVSARAESSLTVSSWCAALFLAHEAWYAADPTVAGARTAAAATAAAAFAAGVAVLVGRRTSGRSLPAWGPLVLLAFLGAALVFEDRPRAVPPLDNRFFLAGLGVFASFAVTAVFGVRQKDLAAKAAVVYLLALATSEAAAWGNHLRGTGIRRDDARFQAGMAMCAVWAVHGLATVVGGWRFDRAWARGLGLAVLACAAFEPVVIRALYDDRAGASVFGPSFYVAVIPSAALVLAAAILRRRRDAGDATTSGVPRVDLPEVGALVAFGLLLTAEIVTWGHRLDSDAAFRTATALTSAWSLVGVACAAISMAVVRPWLRPAAVVFGLLGAFAATTSRLFDAPSTPDAVFGAAFLLGLFPVAAFATAFAAWRRAGGASAGSLRFAAGAALAHVLALVSIEIVLWGAHRSVVAPMTREDARFTAQVALSVFWATYAALHVGAGFLWKSPGLRWGGLGLFSVTVAKVFLIDLSRLDTVSRMGSVLALGVLLVAASFLYQRARKSGGPG